MSEESLFREVDEELRSERMRNMWRRYGPYVIGAAVAVVLLVAANEGWSWWQQSNAARSSDQLYVALDAMDEGDLDSAREALVTVREEGAGGYPVLARFADAAILANQGQTEEAAAAYDALASDLSEVRLRELALVLASFALVDTGDVSAVQTRLSGVISEGSAMRNIAREALGLTQYAAGEGEAAFETFTAITEDPLASLEQSGRVEVYLAQLTAEGAAPVVEEAPAEAAADETSEDAAAEDAPE